MHTGRVCQRIDHIGQAACTRFSNGHVQAALRKTRSRCYTTAALRAGPSCRGSAHIKAFLMSMCWLHAAFIIFASSTHIKYWLTICPLSQRAPSLDASEWSQMRAWPEMGRDTLQTQTRYHPIQAPAIAREQNCPFGS
eukprot:1157866-Pelagomonas_calceolata.AAC.2